MTLMERRADDSSQLSAEAKPIHGVWSPVLVPVDDDFAIDAERFIAHARWLLDMDNRDGTALLESLAKLDFDLG